MMTRKLFAALAAVVFVLSLGTARAQTGEVLRIGVEGAYPPFSWKEPDGSMKGFDIDIAMALCEQLNRTCELVEQDWDGMIPALIANKFDAIVASMSITEERRQRVDFTNKYYITVARLVAKADTDLEPTPAGLAGKRIGVQRGTTHQCYVEKMFPDAELVLYATQEEVFQDLASGRLDAQISDSTQAADGFLGTDAGEGFAFLGGDQYDLECHGEGAGIAVRKGEDELREALNGAITAIRDSGTYAEINAKYFDFDLYGE